MTDHPAFAQLSSDLFQRDRGLYVVPIRHHSPACAWHLRQLIAEVRPAHVLIEAPSDFAGQIPLLLDPATVPPVALVALVDPKGDAPRVAGYYPFCAHSPEYIALRDGDALGAQIRFIDAPAADKALRRAPDMADPLALSDEHHFDSSDYTDALARATGCRDGFELWDHLFETQIGGDDWRSFFGDVGVYCAGIRAATSEAAITASGDTNREAHMARAVDRALKDGGPVVVVVGGFHAPALIGDWAQHAKPEPVDVQADCYLIRYGFRALDALNGYAAGLPQPGYYQHLWDRVTEGGLDWRGVAIDLLSGFTAQMRDDGHVFALPSQIEAIRMAEGLAQMRGRPGALRHDLIDGVQAALVKGEQAGRDAVTDQFRSYLCGDMLGDVPASAGSPPLVEDVRHRAQAARFTLTDSSTRRRKLDIRRKDAHLRASQFCHALTLLGVPFASCEVGPDYLSGHRTDLLFEEWSYAWTPRIEGHLIERAILGDDLPTACLAHLTKTRHSLIAQGNARDLPQLVTLLSQGLLAGLGDALPPFLANLGDDLQNYGTFDTVADALRRLMFLRRATGPMRAPDTLDLGGTIQAGYARLVYLCDDLTDTAPDHVTQRLEALRIVIEILRDCDQADLDRALLEGALDRVADSTKEPVILGAVLAICVQSGLRQSDDLIHAVQGRLSGVALETAARIGVLRGILHTAPMLLWHAQGLLGVIDQFLSDLPETDFLDLLPHLRLAFTALNPRETDRLAHELAGLHGVQAGSLLRASTSATETDLTRALTIERDLITTLEQDGLAAWLTEDHR